MPKIPLNGRTGFTLIEVLVVVIMVGILFTISFQSFAGARDRSSNALVDGNIRQIQSALTVYQADNERLPRFLVADAGNSSLLEVPTAPTRNVQYLPGNKLPRAAWTENWQGNNLNKIAADMPASTDADAGFFRIADANKGSVKLRLPAAPKALIAGKLPAQPTGAPAAANFKYSNYGAVMYETNGNQSLYILHGVGKSRADARVVALATNAR